MGRWILLSLVMGCAREEAPAPSPGPLPVEDGPPPIDALPVQWTPAPGWVLSAARTVGDVDGDGRVDAAVSAVSLDGASTDLLIVAGPLRRARVLPGDQLSRIRGASLASVGDATGDGVVDVDVRPVADPYGYVLLAGPLPAVTDPSAGYAHAFPAADVDGDGILDEYTTGPGVELTWGPAERWEGPPDVALEPICAGHAVTITEAPLGLPDVDGDGVAELWLGGAGRCPGMVYPLLASGTLGPDDLIAEGIAELRVVPDQTGDGADDLLVDGYDGGIYATPVTFVKERAYDWTIASDVRIPLGGDSLQPQRFDLNADGFADFVFSAPGALSAILGGPEPVADASWDLVGGEVSEHAGFLEDGVGSALAAWSGGIVVVDLGGATEVP